MKYDCTKTLDYSHEKKRMCGTYRTCLDACLEGCPLKTVGCEGDITQGKIAIVQKWSDEHPEKTRADVFFEMFPNAILTSDGYPQTCFNDLVDTLDSCVKDCGVCWSELYNGEFEKAREE